MSSSIRTSNLFAGEDYKKIFKAYQFIDYTAYDFDSLKQALLNYIQIYYPEDFNDYIESSEFVAIVELLAYFGTSLAFRTELNSRENFIDTAERRESIIRLAQMVNYIPSRNIAANGLFKISSIQTNQPITDANGVDIGSRTIYWNDANNVDWFDQFMQVCNASFSQLNPFGRPTKSGSIGGIPTDLYQLNNVLRLNVTYPVFITINGQQYPVDICNPDFVSNQTIFERHPDPANAFNFIYRNDSLGMSSANTGFFLYFKQGTLINTDTNFEFPQPSRLFPINNNNINQDDVYVQETDQTGKVLNKWLKVPALSGENIIYNSIQFAQRNIFDVLSGANDTITIRFADGNFGNVPTGLFRIWTRVSANQSLVIRPTDVQSLQINIPYVGTDQQSYTLQVVFNLEQTIGNSAPAETNEQIKMRAPEVFSTQSRMVNGSDYNVLPLIYGNQIAKVRALDRTYSGQSRYLDLNDPTGFHKDLIIFGQDGALFRDNQNVLVEVIKDSSNAGTIEQIIVNNIQTMLRDQRVNNFFYDEYLPQFESKIRVNKQSTNDAGYSILDLSNPYQRHLYWKTSPSKFKNRTGYFANTTITGSAAVELKNEFTPYNPTELNHNAYEPWALIEAGAVLQFANPNNISVVNTIGVGNVVQSGLPIIINPLNPYANIGPVELVTDAQTNYRAVHLFPVFRNMLNPREITEISTTISNGVSFWIYYDLLQDEWRTSITITPGITDQLSRPWEYAQPNTNSIYSNWGANASSGLLYVSIASNNNQTRTTTYSLTARGRVYVFESYRDVRFYWEPNQTVVDNSTGLALQDTISIMPLVNTNSTVDNNLPIIINPVTSYIDTEVKFNLSGAYTQADGYRDPSKMQVSLVDENGDGIPDDPTAFSRVVANTDRIVFEYYTDPVFGYQSSRPWIAKWKTDLQHSASDLFVYFPILTPGVDRVLYSSPYIANMRLTSNNDIINPTGVAMAGFKYVYMDEVDLVFIHNESQLTYTDPLTSPLNTISNQLTAFFNNNTTIYPWLHGSHNIINKAAIVTDYFINKSFLLSSVSPPGFGIYKTLKFSTTRDTRYSVGNVISEFDDLYHYDKNGKVFTQNTDIPDMNHIPLHFKWCHYSPVDQRVDPAVSNIIDMVVVTNSYYTDMSHWKSNNGSLLSLPQHPTTEELRLQFQNLDQYKMVSDSMIWNSGTFKILFGNQAPPELQATFKVVKSASSNVSDNEVKTQVITAIDQYFDIRNWDFGEKFFYTELAAFIHQQLSKSISSIVIVPTNSDSLFGNLFEIIASPTELYMSTATVNNVQIVANLTDQNLRV